MKKLNLLFGFLVIFALTFTSCYKEDFPTDGDYADEFYDDYEGDNQGDYDDYDEGEGGYHDSDDGHDHGGDEAKSIANYEVDGDFLIKKSTGNGSQTWMSDEAKHQFMWEHFTKMVPTDQRRWVTEFEIFEGGGDLLGYVEPIQEGDLSRWKFALAIDVAYVNNEFDKDGEYTYTVIHEYGHILTLNDTQIDANANSCSNFNPAEGCAYADSYIHQFQRNYWADIMGELENGNEGDIYDKYPDRFVTPYASSNPGEDIAETFTFFVTKDDAPQGNKIADKKVRFMYDFPELVSLRNNIRQSSTVLPRAGEWKRAKQIKSKKYKKGMRIVRR